MHGKAKGYESYDDAVTETKKISSIGSYSWIDRHLILNLWWTKKYNKD